MSEGEQQRTLKVVARRNKMRMGTLEQGDIVRAIFRAVFGSSVAQFHLPSRAHLYCLRVALMGAVGRHEIAHCERRRGSDVEAAGRRLQESPVPQRWRVLQHACAELCVCRRLHGTAVRAAASGEQELMRYLRTVRTASSLNKFCWAASRLAA